MSCFQPSLPDRKHRPRRYHLRAPRPPPSLRRRPRARVLAAPQGLAARHQARTARNWIAQMSAAGGQTNSRDQGCLPTPVPASGNASASEGCCRRSRMGQAGA
eukprot:10410151-Alexandrium_andersonii.AAC.1